MPHLQQAFNHKFASMAVHFGAGVVRQLPFRVDELGAKRALVLSTPSQSDVALRLASYLGSLAGGVYTSLSKETPDEIADDAVQHLRHTRADCTVAIGGGSAIGLGKRVAARTKTPQILVPTTYSGSEIVSDGAPNGQGRGSLTGGVSKIVIYDPELTLDVPLRVTVASALGAVAHAVEALYAPNRSPYTSMLAREGLRAFASALPALIADSHAESARSEALYGAWICGTVLGQVETGLHHRLCAFLVQDFRLPHADTSAVLLPHSVACRESDAQELLAPVREILGGGTAAGALSAFARRSQAPASLREIGVTRGDLDLMTERVAAPDVLSDLASTVDVRTILQNAWAGTLISA